MSSDSEERGSLTLQGAKRDVVNHRGRRRGGGPCAGGDVRGAVSAAMEDFEQDVADKRASSGSHSAFKTGFLRLSQDAALSVQICSTDFS